MYLNMVKILEDNYPEMLKKLCVVNGELINYLIIMMMMMMMMTTMTMMMMTTMTMMMMTMMTTMMRMMTMMMMLLTSPLIIINRASNCYYRCNVIITLMRSLALLHDACCWWCYCQSALSTNIRHLLIIINNN